ncbi:hypothetical protein EHS25_007886 [Saitozyma podzolica]|uniref:Uncharacterized protein n=1 Tax=Saitozyma podzolica TaxID=1890683 RepID=A0A427YQZ5_9TREE|nr:hypothetical protein EHS25_007886 [Saitozyma podzolica]
MASEDRKERSSRSSSSSSRSEASKVDKAKQQARDAAKTATDAAKTAKDAVAPVLNGAVDALGGWDGLDQIIWDYNPTLADYADSSFLAKASGSNSPARFVLLLLAVGLLQSIIPVFAWPLDFCAQLLGFLFLYNTGISSLQQGFESSKSIPRVKSLLAALLITSAAQLVPVFLFDGSYHFGALWSFALPALLFVTPTKGGDTVVMIICDTLFAQVGEVLRSVVPEALQDDQGSQLVLIGGVLIALLLSNPAHGPSWVGYLGATASYLSTWFFIALSTLSHLSRPLADKADKEAYRAQQTVWHNLLALWLWRYLISAVESITVPGLISVMGLILHYLPSYFLWMTAFFLGMMVTKKTREGNHANSWYARWLLGGLQDAIKKPGGGGSSKKAKPSSSGAEGSKKPPGSGSGSGSSSKSSKPKPK